MKRLPAALYLNHDKPREGSVRLEPGERMKGGLDNPSSAQHREQSNSLAEVKGGDAGWKRIPQPEDLRRERYLSSKDPPPS